MLETLWPHLDPDAAGNNLRVTLHFARKLLDPMPDGSPAALQLRDEQIALFPNRSIQVDVTRFETAAQLALRADDPAACQAALDLYRGELLPEDRFEEWAIERRDSLHAVHLTLLRQLAQTWLARGQHDRAIETLQQMVGEDPAGETAHVELMRLYALSGQRARALRQYQQLRETLEHDLDVAPDPSTTHLYEAILTGSFDAGQLPTPITPSPATALTRPAPMPRPTTPDVPPTNLPLQLSSFVGRQHECTRLTDALGDSRLVTLTGPGGAGKTRLALEVAGSLLAEYDDGVWLVDLTDLVDATLVARTVAVTLDVQEADGRPTIDALTEALADRTLLLIIDNCEHLIDAVAALADHLLKRCPKLRILATSREALRVPGEVVWPVPALAVPVPHQLPPLDAFVEIDAVRLFIERARLQVPDLHVTAENATAIASICHTLDGLPLAIELAAARAGMLSVGQISARLDHALQLLTTGSRTGPPHHRSLRATIEWSYDLLDEPERSLLPRLAIFAGGFTLDAAEAVCSDQAIPSERVAESLFQLVDKSLILIGEGDGLVRYRLLETIRQFGIERLAALGLQQVTAQCHAEWARQLASLAEPELHGPAQAIWLSRLDQEHDNLRLALEWCLVHRIDAGLTLASDLAWFWRVRGTFTEGRAWLQRLLDLAPDGTPDLARALHSAGMLAAFQGDRQTARPLLERSLALSRAEDDPPGIIRALDNLARVELSDGNPERARAYLVECLARAREIGDHVGISATLDSLGDLDWVQSNYQGAWQSFEESLTVRRLAGDTRGTGWALMKLGNIARIQGDGQRARQLLSESLDLARQLGNRWDSGWTLGYLGVLALTEGDDDDARVLLRESLQVFREVGDRIGSAYSLLFSGLLAILGGETDLGTRLVASAVAHEQRLGVWLTNDEQSRRDQVLSDARAQLGQQRFAAAWDAGHALTLEDAVATALTDRPQPS